METGGKTHRSVTQTLLQLGTAHTKATSNCEAAAGKISRWLPYCWAWLPFFCWLCGSRAFPDRACTHTVIRLEWVEPTKAARLHRQASRSYVATSTSGGGSAFAGVELGLLVSLLRCDRRVEGLDAGG